MSYPVVAILDAGANEKLHNMGFLAHNIEITSDLQIHKREDYDPLFPSYGTNCAAIIKKYTNDAILSSVKILNNDSHKGMKEQLILALKWCADNGINIANLSFGTIDFRDFIEIRDVVKINEAALRE